MKNRLDPKPQREVVENKKETKTVKEIRHNYLQDVMVGAWLLVIVLMLIGVVSMGLPSIFLCKLFLEFVSPIFNMIVITILAPPIALFWLNLMTDKLAEQFPSLEPRFEFIKGHVSKVLSAIQDLVITPILRVLEPPVKFVKGLILRGISALKNLLITPIFGAEVPNIPASNEKELKSPLITPNVDLATPNLVNDLNPGVD